MKVVLITMAMPTAENFRAGSAIIYHEAKYRPKDIELKIYTFNSNQVPKNDINRISEDINARVEIVSLPTWYVWMFKLHLAFLRHLTPLPFLFYIKLPNNIIKKIRDSHPDKIWICGDNLLSTLVKFHEYHRILSFTDSIALYYYRALGDPYVLNNPFRMLGNLIYYFKYVKVTKKYPTDDSIHYHLVGKDDANFINSINPKMQCHFINHPHYNYLEYKVIKFSSPKIKLLITGGYDIYTKTAVDSIITLFSNNRDLSSFYQITFLGKNWELQNQTLKNEGFETYHIKFAPIYAEELIKHDIQLVPISVGTGTKGKVLDALSNGLLVIGTPYALENIAIEKGVSCIEYKDTANLLQILYDIPKKTQFYENIAEKGRVCVLKQHDRSLNSKKLFTL